MFGDSTSIFMQLADQLYAEVVAGTYPNGTKAPSIDEPAAFHHIDPATANHAITLLVERGVLIERRGVGIFAAGGTRLHLIEERHQALVDRCVHPLIAEAATLGISGRELIAPIQKEVSP